MTASPGISTRIRGAKPLHALLAGATEPHALAGHFGHVTRVMTDASYVGTDFELGDLVDAEVLDETRAALEELLTATQLAGKAGRTFRLPIIPVAERAAYEDERYPRNAPQELRISAPPLAGSADR
jgi:hypothetical protein